VTFRSLRTRGSARDALCSRVCGSYSGRAGDPDYHFNEALRLGNYRTLLGVPMLREGTPIGVVTLTRLGSAAFTEKQIELVATLRPGSHSIENVRLSKRGSAHARTGGVAGELRRRAGPAGADRKACLARPIRRRLLARLVVHGAGLSNLAEFIDQPPPTVRRNY